MGNIIRLHPGRHDEIRALLPWYVTGRLDETEHARVAAHVSSCRECQEELEFERRLEVEVAIAPVDVEHGWASMQRRLETASPARKGGAIGAWYAKLVGGTARIWRAGPSWLGWALASQAVLVLIAGALAGRMTVGPAAPARYHTLSSVPATPAGNVVVIFRPDTREEALRHALQAADARLIDGPTAADAYVLHVPPAERTSALAGLRARREVVLAQPLDPDGPS
jgi:anti-sigma factor RsiW